jgi:hypothetical protein
MPDYLKSSFIGNSQFSILRKNINNREEFRNTPTMIINHENYIDQEGHEHSDQTSFILYYKGRQLLIDPGYIPAAKSYWFAKEWLVSPFAHNLIMVNPYRGITEGHSESLELERDYYNPLDYYNGNHTVNSIIDYWNDIDYLGEDLGNPNNYDFKYRDFEPIGQTWLSSEHNNTGIPPVNFPPYNPAQKEYFIDNNNIQHLQISVSYDHPQLQYGGAYNGEPSDIIDIKRNFYMINRASDNPYFIIYDEVLSSDPFIENEFMNQLHFAVHPVTGNNTVYQWNDVLETYDDGKFKLETAENMTSTSSTCSKMYLHGAMGAGNSFDKIEVPNLPQGQYMGISWNNMTPPQWEHDCMRIVTNNVLEGEKFLTVLYPSEEDNNPIDSIINEDGVYAIENIEFGYLEEESGTFSTLTGINNTDLDNSYWDSTHNVVTDGDFFYIKYFKIARNNNLSVMNFITNGGTHLSYQGTELFVNEGDEFDGIIVSYEDNVCRFTLYPENSSKKKIARNNSVFSFENISNQTLVAYDDDFYFINYQENELPAGAKIYIHHERIDIRTNVNYENQLFGPDVFLNVLSGGILHLTGLTSFGKSTKITVEAGGILEIVGEIRDETQQWQGIEAKQNSIVNIINSSIIASCQPFLTSNGAIIEVHNSFFRGAGTIFSLTSGTELNFTSSIMEIKENGTGISLTGRVMPSVINISGTEESPSVFSGLIATNATGILIQTGLSQVSIGMSEFTNLTNGVKLVGIQNSEIAISNSSFRDCTESGIFMHGNYESEIQISSSIFYNNEIGIESIYTDAKINSCEFVAEPREQRIGVKLENTFEFNSRNLPDFDPSFYNENTISQCTFDNLFKGLVAKNSSPRLIFNQFEGCTFAITSCDQSFVDISWNSRNEFLHSENSLAYLFFHDLHNPFVSTMKLRYGHNNFNDYSNKRDFWAVNGSTIFIIDANYNYWGVDSLIYSTPNNIYTCTYFDEFPNVTSYPHSPSNRYDEAVHLDKDREYEAALNMYKAILIDQLPEEQKYWGESIDRVFHITGILKMDFAELIVFYESLKNNPPDYLNEDELLAYQKLLADYIKKCSFILKEYPEAKLIVQERIDDPINELDGLYAQLDLVNIEFVEELENEDKSVGIDYTNHVTQEIGKFQTRRADIWEKINNLLDIDDGNEIIIPSYPVLASNYPNPFNPETTISFSIPKDAKVNLAIFNIKGQKVKTIANGEFERGKHQVVWNGKDKNNKSVASGVYFYKLDVNGKTEAVKKCMLLK